MTASRKEAAYYKKEYHRAVECCTTEFHKAPVLNMVGVWNNLVVACNKLVSHSWASNRATACYKEYPVAGSYKFPAGVCNKRVSYS